MRIDAPRSDDDVGPGGDADSADGAAQCPDDPAHMLVGKHVRNLGAYSSASGQTQLHRAAWGAGSRMRRAGSRMRRGRTETNCCPSGKTGAELADASGTVPGGTGGPDGAEAAAALTL